MLPVWLLAGRWHHMVGYQCEMQPKRLTAQQCGGAWQHSARLCQARNNGVRFTASPTSLLALASPGTSSSRRMTHRQLPSRRSHPPLVQLSSPQSAQAARRIQVPPTAARQRSSSSAATTFTNRSSSSSRKQRRRSSSTSGLPSSSCSGRRCRCNLKRR